MTEKPPASTRSHDMEPHVDKMTEAATMSLEALRPAQIVIPSNDIFSMHTGLSGEYRIKYRSNKLYQCGHESCMRYCKTYLLFYNIHFISKE
jgi:hypothetical protein